MKIEEVLAHPWITKYIEPEFKELREQAIKGVGLLLALETKLFVYVFSVLGIPKRQGILDPELYIAQ